MISTIALKEFQLSETIKRISNGLWCAFSSFKNPQGSTEGIHLAWNFHINPLEVAGGEKSNLFTKIEKDLEELSCCRGKFVIIFGAIDGWPRIIITTENNLHRAMELVVAPSEVDHLLKYGNLETRSFDTLLELLLFIRTNMCPTGAIKLEDTIPKISDHRNGWSLHKETYTNEEVCKIVDDARKEMLETINQLTNRLLNRIKN